MPLMGVERRAEIRYSYISSVQFSSPSENGEELFVGTTINISESGLCLYSYVPLSEGRKITIKSPFRARYRTFTVRWVSKLLDDFFMVGLLGKS